MPSTLLDMRNKTTEVEIIGKTYTARQLLIGEWAQVEEELQGTGVSLDDIFTSKTSIIGFRAIVEIAIGQPISPQTNIKELFIAAGQILDLDTMVSEVPNSQAAPVKPQEE